MKYDMLKFISYDGEYPCLCMGTLTAKINRKTYKFSYNWLDMSKKYPKFHWCPAFWGSGGSFKTDEDWNMWAEKGDWTLSIYDDRKHFPDEVWNNRERLIDLFNENVIKGCCGGCI